MDTKRSADMYTRRVGIPPYVRPLPIQLSASTLDGFQRAGCCDLPEGEAQKAVIEAYLDWVQPTLPMLDPSHLRALANHASTGASISLLLFKALEMAACISSRQDSLNADALAAQFDVLLRARVETDPLTVLQSLILMSFSDGGRTGCKDGYYWIGLATTYAGRLLGVRGELSHSLRRTLWCLIFRDSMVALASRKPRQISSEVASTVSSLTADELEIGTGTTICGRGIDASVYEEGESDVDVRTALYDLSTALQATADLKLAHVQSMSAGVAARILRCWYTRWHEPLRINSRAPEQTVRNSVLLVYWSLAVLTLQCWSSQPNLVANISEDHSLVTAALNCTTAVYAKLIEERLLQHIPCSAVAALVPAAVAYISNSTSVDQSARAMNSQKYYQCWLVLRELRSKYRTAHQAMIMLDSLGQRLKQAVDDRDAEHMTKLKMWCGRLQA